MVKKQKEEKKVVITIGKRKKAIARAVFKPGDGKITINTKPLEFFSNEIIRLKMQEPAIIAGDVIKAWNISVNVKGGGMMGQAEAVRQAIAKGLVEINPELKRRFLDYDRSLLIADARRTEPRKPPHSSWGARRYKQRSKR